MDLRKSLLFIFGLVVSSLCQDPELVGLRDFSGNKVWDTLLSLSNEPVSFYEPRILGEQHRALGHRAQPNRNNLEDELLYVSPVDPEGDAMRAPEGFNFIWDDRLSTAASSASIFRTFCGDGGYVALGDLAYPANRVSVPEELFESVTCVRTNLTEACNHGDMIWDDRGMVGSFDVSVWATNASADAVPGFFNAVGGYDVQPPNSPRCLLKSSYIPTKKTL